jgi:hypothetical protein
MLSMKRYLAVYTGSASNAAVKAWDAMSDAEREKHEEQGMKAWHEWVQKNKASIIEGGAPLGTTKKVDKKGIADISNQMAAFTLVQAESHEAAAKLFLNHPHFTIFPGDAVEIMECLPIPGMG